MSPLGQTLESGFAVVKVLSVLEVCPLGVQVFNVMIFLLISVDRPSPQTSWVVMWKTHKLGTMGCVSNPSPWEIQSGGSTSAVYQV